MKATCPIWLVVGFLGAGKTTLLRQLVHVRRAKHFVYVINEFSSVDVDAAIIEHEGGVSMAVAGGSIFCRCLITEFVDVMRRVAEGVPGPDGPTPPPRGVVIEASGMADPRSMRRLLSESGLDSLFHVAGVVAVVDPGTLTKLLAVLPNIRGQIATADLILLNKADLYAPEMMAGAAASVLAINPNAVVVRCTKGLVDPAVVLADGVSQRVEQVDAAFGQCRDPDFERETVRFEGPVRLQDLCERLDAAKGVLYRAKGFVHTSGGWKYVDWSAGVLSISETEPARISAVTLIWNPRAAEAERIAHIKSCP